MMPLIWDVYICYKSRYVTYIRYSGYFTIIYQTIQNKLTNIIHFNNSILYLHFYILGNIRCIGWVNIVWTETLKENAQFLMFSNIIHNNWYCTTNIYIYIYVIPRKISILNGYAFNNNYFDYYIPFFTLRDEVFQKMCVPVVQ